MTIFGHPLSIALYTIIFVEKFSLPRIRYISYIDDAHGLYSHIILSMIKDKSNMNLGLP